MYRYGKRLQTLPPHPTLGEALCIFHTWHCLIRKSKVCGYCFVPFKGLGGLFDTGQPATDIVNPQPCSLQNPDDILRMLPGRFLSEDDLIHIVPETRSWVSL